MLKADITANYLFTFELAKWGKRVSYDGGSSSFSSSAGAVPRLELCVEAVAELSAGELNAVDRVLRRLLLLFDAPFVFDLVCVSCSGKKQSLICQQSHKHEPTPTNVKINEVNALITISVLLVVASFDVTTIGGFGHFPPSSTQ